MVRGGFFIYIKCFHIFPIKVPLAMRGWKRRFPYKIQRPFAWVISCDTRNDRHDSKSIVIPPLHVYVSASMHFVYCFPFRSTFIHQKAPCRLCEGPSQETQNCELCVWQTIYFPFWSVGFVCKQAASDVNKKRTRDGANSKIVYGVSLN
jgi:hypothetical protein